MDEPEVAHNLYQKRKWKPYGLRLDHISFALYPDLIPAMICCMDAAVEYWDEHPLELVPPTAEQYREAVFGAGMGWLYKYIGGMQTNRNRNVDSIIQEIESDKTTDNDNEQQSGNDEDGLGTIYKDIESVDRVQ